MKVVTRTDEYTIYQKRNERYAIRNSQRQWVRGDEKVAILLAQGLIKAPTPKAPEPEPVAEEAAAPETAAESEGAADEAPAAASEDTKES